VKVVKYSEKLTRLQLSVGLHRRPGTLSLPWSKD